MKIVQVIVNLERGDAIGNFTILLDNMLKRAGFKTEIVACRAGKGIPEGLTKKKEEIKKLDPDDVLIYQMCESNPVNRLIECAVCRKIAIYHNVTPPHFFNKWGSFMTELQKTALEDLASMRNVFDHVIAVSEYNKRDLIGMGYDESIIDVIPILIDFDDYQQSPDMDTINKYDDGYTNILFVGRIVPNKKQEDIIQTYAYYKKHINSKSRLILAGSPFSDDYFNDLKKYIETIGVADVVMPGHVSFKEILAYYNIADILLCMSEHEGFCVPMLEAMMFDVPIVTYAGAAIPETIGDSGAMFYEKNPVVVSYLIDRVVRDAHLRDTIIEKQRAQLEKYSKEKIETIYLNKIKDFIGE